MTLSDLVLELLSNNGVLKDMDLVMEVKQSGRKSYESKICSVIYTRNSKMYTLNPSTWVKIQ